MQRDTDTCSKKRSTYFQEAGVDVIGGRDQNSWWGWSVFVCTHCGSPLSLTWGAGIFKKYWVAHAQLGGWLWWWPKRQTFGVLPFQNALSSSDSFSFEFYLQAFNLQVCVPNALRTDSYQDDEGVRDLSLEEELQVCVSCNCETESLYWLLKMQCRCI